MLAFQFGSNLPIILLIIVILLVCLYFYLDMRKVKVIQENLDNKNEMIVKEIDNIHLQMHKFFSRMPQSIVPRKVNPKMTQNIVKKEPTDKILEEEAEESNQDDKPNDVEAPPNDATEISENEFNNLKKQTHSNNIFGEVEEMISNNNNNISQDNVPVSIEPPPLIPFEYDTADKVEKEKENDDDVDDDNEVGTTDDEVDDDDNEVGTTDDEVDDEVDDDVDLLLNNKDDDEYKLEEYMKMSVKGLKAKCIEMNLQHSGNKSALAKRIVGNL